VSEEQTLAVEVSAVEKVTPLIKHFTLSPVGGGRLPAFSGGSHIVVVMRAGGGTRVHRNPYSLLSSPQRLDAYEIGVRRMEESRGGSHFMHDRVEVGTRLEIAHPVNLFALDKIARKHVLIAGGIGITPFLAQLEDLHQGRVPYELHYSVRSPEHAAFLPKVMRSTMTACCRTSRSARMSMSADPPARSITSPRRHGAGAGPTATFTGNNSAPPPSATRSMCFWPVRTCACTCRPIKA
jgi:ferredoxin-NADP reductase